MRLARCALYVGIAWGWAAEARLSVRVLLDPGAWWKGVQAMADVTYRIKPLEWNQFEDSDFVEAKSAYGPFYVNAKVRRWDGLFAAWCHRINWSGCFATIDDAKLAAETAYREELAEWLEVVG